MCGATVLPSAPPEVWPSGLVLDERFEVAGLIGRGAHADVYRGLDRLLGRPVAIKAVRRDRLAGSAGGWVREQLLREARLVARLEHPTIVQIYDAGQESGVPWIAMQLVTGGSLSGLLESAGALEPRVAIRVMAQAAEALDFAHALGIVHRDLKPANILIAGQGSDGVPLIKLGDFGIARLLGDPREPGDGPSDQVVGTPAYMSPEQISGGEVGARSDLFSFASVAYELLTGRRAFTGASFHELFLQISAGRYQPPSRSQGALPEALDAVFSRSFAAAPAERYATAGEFARALAAALPEAARIERASGLAGYELLDEVSGSLVARVFRARRLADRRTVALKIASESRGRTSLKREIRYLARLDHPAIPKTLDSGETAEATYIAREWIEGARRLPEILASRRLELAECLRIAIEIADALEHAHKAAVLHLDLRPNSVVLAADGTVCLGGFDRALERGERAGGDLLALGTPAYLSPEQIRQESELGPAADLYAFGVVLFELVTGRVPFADPSPYLTAMRHLNEPAPHLDSVVSGVPHGLTELVARLLAKEPGTRPRSAAEVRDALRALAAAPAANATSAGGSELSWLEWREVAVAQIDVVGFLELARGSSETRIAFLLERWYELVTRTAVEFGGEVSSWMGDSAMLIFPDEKGQAAAGIRALRMLRALARYVEEVNRSLDWELAFAGGVHQDRCLVGRVMTRSDGGATLVGLAPAEAARLCQRAGRGSILVSEQVRAQASGEFAFERGEASGGVGSPTWLTRFG